MVFDFLDLFFLILAAKRSKNDVFRSNARLTAKTKNFRHFSTFCRILKILTIFNISGKKQKMTLIFPRTLLHVRHYR